MIAKKTEAKLLAQAIKFSEELPHLQQPFASRNWGHKLHSLCSYQGKLKPSLAHFLVKYFSDEEDIILDPMSGAGTIPLEALLNNRVAIGNDIQELGYFLTLAKTKWEKSGKILESYERIKNYIKDNSNDQEIGSYAHFGKCGKIPDYFHNDTLKEILAAREYLKQNTSSSWEDAVVCSALLHILHGNRPYALSRNSHPITPFRPTGEFIYKSLVEKLLDKIERVLALDIPNNTKDGIATCVPFEDLNYNSEIDVIITSPPFASSTKFYNANWMRLWMAGWEPEDFSSRPKDFLEEKQRKSMDAYKVFFECCSRWLKLNGKLVMHVGKTEKCNMKEEIIKRIPSNFKLVYSFDEDVKGREKFGIKDQGATLSHQYLFLIKQN